MARNLEASGERLDLREVISLNRFSMTREAEISSFVPPILFIILSSCCRIKTVGRRRIPKFLSAMFQQQSGGGETSGNDGGTSVEVEREQSDSEHSINFLYIVS